MFSSLSSSRLYSRNWWTHSTQLRSLFPPRDLRVKSERRLRREAIMWRQLIGRRCMSTSSSIQAVGWWDHVRPAPKDAILCVSEAFLADTTPNKINLGVVRTTLLITVTNVLLSDIFTYTYPCHTRALIGTMKGNRLCFNAFVMQRL